MAEFDDFANQLLEEAKRFLEKAKDCADVAAEAANLHAALMLSFCAFEAHVNSIAEEFSLSPGLSAHEKGILLERDVKLENGEFQLLSGLRIARLEDRIEFLCAKFAGEPLDRSATWWSRLGSAMDLRNKLTHPKNVTPVTESAVRGAIEGIVDALQVLYEGIYKRKFPPAGQGLQSRLTF